MILYFLKTIILLGIFYTLYTLFLKNKKTFQWNRVYLVLTSLLTVFLPFVNAISLGRDTQTVRQNQLLSVTLDTIDIYGGAVKNTEIDFGKIILGIYAVGLLWGLLRVILGFIVIRRIKNTSEAEKYETRIVYFNDQIESPFSFNTYIFIPGSFKNKPVLQTILGHEMAHIEMMHTRDKVLFSFLQAVFWFNPFVYLYHKELELIHEFEADDLTTRKMSTDDYVQNLLQTVTYNQTPTILVHQFFHHPLKTRITMLYKKSKNALVQKGIVVVATFIICLFTLFAQSYAQKKSSDKKGNYTVKKYPNDTIEMEKPNGGFETVIVKRNPDTLYEMADVMPEFYGGNTEMVAYIADNLKYPEFEAKNNIEGKVMVNFTIDKEGHVSNVKATRIPIKGDNLAKEAVRVVEGMPKWKPGKQDGKPVSVNYNIPIDFKLKK